MGFLDSPKDYNECLAKLNGATFITTLIFFIFLRFFELVPQVKIPAELIPPIKDHKELIEWVLSFGVIPLIAASLAFFASHTFELHNKVAWLVGVRSFWSRQFILRPLSQRAKSAVALTPENAKLIMSELYYPGIKEIDQHYVRLFWRYTTQFWILFEHLIVVFVTVLVLSALSWGTSVAYLWLYFISMVALSALHFFFVAAPRSKKQAEEIPAETVEEFFSTHFQEHNKKEGDICGE